MADFGFTELAAAIAATSAADAGAAAVGATAAEGLAGFGAAPLAGAAASGFALPSLSTIGTVAGLGGTLLQAKAGMDNAAYQEALQKSEATALQQKSNDDAAAAERAQITQQRQTDLVLSRARALAADSGTTATSPDVLNTEGRIAQQGQYNAQTALFQGQSRSRADLYQGDIDLFNAKRISDAAPLTAAGTILSGLSSFASNRSMLRAYQKTGTLPMFGAA